MHQQQKRAPVRSKKRGAVTTEYTGIVRITGRGTGYLDHSESEKGIEIAHEYLNRALHGDTVRVALRPQRYRDRLQGEVLEVLTRARTRFIGILEEEGGYVFFKPDDHRVYIDFIMERDPSAPVPRGQKVIVELVRWTSPTMNPLARLIDVLGPAGEHETEMRSVVAEQGFAWQFPPDVEQQAADIERTKAAFFASESGRRRDFRTVPTFTVDPDDAKDFDDAISVRMLDHGTIELGIHIADVSAYLLPGSSMDVEAQKRATSVYLVDRTIPMLPEALSNDLCSLVPNEDRLCMSAVFELTSTGDIRSAWYGETIIHSNRRFTYREAQDILTTGHGPLFTELLAADTIARTLREARMRNGSIAFETDEIKFELDRSGTPLRAFRKERLDSMLMIEDLMLLANREVATWAAEQLKRAKGVFVWRIHDTPKADRIQELALFLDILGHDLPHVRGQVSAQAINTLFDSIRGTPEQDMIETAVIRSMAKAIYSTKNIGHFGLAFNYYTHFTSPIRRYPDVLVHRLIKGLLAGQPVGARACATYESLCAHCTEREIAAMDAERTSVKVKQVEYLSQKIGEEFTGVISGITDWGMFIMEDATMAEGLVRTSSLTDDLYQLADHGFRLKGARTKRTLSLGDHVRMRLVATDIERKTIDWELVP